MRWSRGMSLRGSVVLTLIFVPATLFGSSPSGLTSAAAQSTVESSIKDCIKAAPGNLKKDIRETLCNMGGGRGPGECASAARGVQGLSSSTDAVVSLCRGALSDAPARCAKALPGTLAGDLKVQLCKGVARLSSGQADLVAVPAACFKALPKRLTNVEGVALCASATSVAPATCATAATRSLPPGFGSSSIVQLCREATTAPSSASSGGSGADWALGPVACAKSAGTGAKNPGLVVDLCAGARDDTPARCLSELRGAAQKLSQEHKVALCRSGGGGSGPALCASQAPATLSDQLRVSLCRGASGTGEEPVRCFKESKSVLKEPVHQVSLCAGMSSTQGGTTGSPVAAVVACVKAAPYMLAAEFKAQLCRGAAKLVAPGHSSGSGAGAGGMGRVEAGAGPGLCVKTLSTGGPTGGGLRVGYDDEETAQALRLCQGATSEMPARCFQSSPKTLTLSQRASLCQGARSESPAVCAGYKGGAGSGFISHAVTGPGGSAGGSSKNAGERAGDLVVKVCAGAGDVGPMECLGRSPFGVGDEGIVRLCRHSGSHAAACAVAAVATGRMRPPEAARLCEGASVHDHLAPVNCINAAPLSLSHNSRGVGPLIQLCSGATSATPGHCASSVVANGRDVDGFTLFECRNSQSMASGVRIKRMWWDTDDKVDGIVANKNIHIILEVQDQYGQPRPYDNTTSVRASIDLARAKGATLDGIKGNISFAGEVTFHLLRFSHSGTYDLRFSLSQSLPSYDTDEDESAKKHVETLRVVVNAPEDEGLGPTGKCGQRLYPLLSSFPVSSSPSTAVAGVGWGPNGTSGTSWAEQDGERARRTAKSIHAALDLVDLSSPETAALVEWPESLDLIMDDCLQVMSDNGMHPTQGWNGAVWVWYRPAMEALETGVGVPAAHQDWYERLSLPMDASDRQIRKAYHRHSLIWHPDRWSAYPESFQRLAQDAFEIVSEAYRMLTDPPVKATITPTAPTSTSASTGAFM